MSQDAPIETKKPIRIGTAERASSKFQGRTDLGHGVYVGPHIGLHMKPALAQRGRKGKVILQFDDLDCGYAHGWHEFLRKHFVKDDSK